MSAPSILNLLKTKSVWKKPVIIWRSIFPFLFAFSDNLMNVYGFLVNLSFLVIFTLYIYKRVQRFGACIRLLECNRNLLSPEDSFHIILFYYLNITVFVLANYFLLSFSLFLSVSTSVSFLLGWTGNSQQHTAKHGTSRRTIFFPSFIWLIVLHKMSDFIFKHWHALLMSNIWNVFSVYCMLVAGNHHVNFTDVNVNEMKREKFFSGSRAKAFFFCCSVGTKLSLF